MLLPSLNKLLVPPIFIVLRRISRKKGAFLNIFPIVLRQFRQYVQEEQVKRVILEFLGIVLESELDNATLPIVWKLLFGVIEAWIVNCKVQMHQFLSSPGVTVIDMLDRCMSEFLFSATSSLFTVSNLDSDDEESTGRVFTQDDVDDFRWPRIGLGIYLHFKMKTRSTLCLIEHLRSANEGVLQLLCITATVRYHFTLFFYLFF